jgi:hypothetical protein
VRRRSRPLVGLEDAAKLRKQLDAALAANDTLHAQLAGTRSSVTDALELVRKAARGEQRPQPARTGRCPSRPEPNAAHGPPRSATAAR